MHSRNKKPSITPDPGLAQISISVEPELKEAIQRRAAADRRSVSAYLCWLAERDIEAAAIMEAQKVKAGQTKTGRITEPT